MEHNASYIREKLVVGLAMLNARSGSLGKRVRDAWEEMSVLESADFSDEAVRRDFEHLLSTKELYVIDGQIPALSQAQFENARARIQRIHDAVVR